MCKRYVDTPLAYRESAHDAPSHHEEEEPDEQARARLNLPMVFRRVVEAGQLHGPTVRRGLKKYDVFHHETGDIFPGDQYHRVPVDMRVWAPHRG